MPSIIVATLNTAGENVLIGAGGVVISDMPDNCTAFGVPASIRSSAELGEIASIR